LTNMCKSSAASTNMRGESGSPCRTLVLHLKNFQGTPFRRTVVDVRVKDVADPISPGGRPK
jgi:hypothetical protein